MISETIKYVGVNDRKIDLFEGQYVVPNGMAYNSYVILDDKVAIMDTADARKGTEWWANVENALAGRQPDYLVVQHAEPDHASLIAEVVGKYPSIKVVATAAALKMLPQFFEGVDFACCGIAVKDGDTLSLGTHTLQFFVAPMVHWPETMVTWLAEENTVFSGDAFGTFGAVNEVVVDSEGTFESFRDEMMRYYSNIVGKYGTPVQSALKKLAAFQVKRICSTHGPVWEKSIPQVVGLYDKMSRYEVERGVCIAYGSMYGNTAAAAEALAEELRRQGVPCAVHDLAGNMNPGLGLSGALRDVFKYDTIVAASPTYNNGIFPPVETFMKALQARLIKGRRFYALGSYTWAGSSVNLLNSFAESLGFEVLAPGLSFSQAYSPKKCNVKEIASILKG